MGLKEIIKPMLSSKALLMKDVAKETSIRLGKNLSPSNFSNKLKAETLTYKELKCIADIAGYDLEFIKRK